MDVVRAITAGLDALAERGRGNRALLVGDRYLADRLTHAAATDGALPGAETVARHVLTDDQLGLLSSAAELSDRIADESPDACLAVGGGSVLDAAKLAVAARNAPWLLDGALWRTGPGMLPAPVAEKPARAPALVAIPTMPGSAAHVSDRVCLAAGAGATRRLVGGPGLVPDDVVYDGDAADTLGVPTLLASICEALYRELGPFLVTARSTPAQDDIGVGHLSGLLRIGEDLLATGRLTVRQRQDLERLSTATMIGRHREDWAPASHPWWCIQNSILTDVAAPKGAVTALGMPHVLERASRGDERWGRTDRVRTLQRGLDESGADARRLFTFFTDVRRRLGSPLPAGIGSAAGAWAHDAYTLWADLVPGISELGVAGIEDLLRHLRRPHRTGLLVV